MKRATFCLLVACTIFQCHKTGYEWTGYDYLQGKWKLIYESDGFWNSSNRTYFPDNYEIEFTKHYKVRKLKNSDEEKKSKVTKCWVLISDPSVGNTCDFNFETDENEQIRATMYTRDPNSDTLYVRGFYPVQYDMYTTGAVDFGVYVRE